MQAGLAAVQAVLVAVQAGLVEIRVKHPTGLPFLSRWFLLAGEEEEEEEAE